MDTQDYDGSARSTNSVVDIPNLDLKEAASGQAADKHVFHRTAI